MTEPQTILITGSSGQLGKSIKSITSTHSNCELVFANRQQLDLSNETSITNFFEHQNYHIIINCAAYTAVDRAELEPELANQVNHLAVRKLADIAKQKNAKLIHISTDYVFNGKQYRPYLETDSIDPLGVYGQTKFSGEEAIQNTLKNNAVIIRTSWMYSEYGENFVKTMLKLGQNHDDLNVICDQVGTPTYSKDLAKAIMCIVQDQKFKHVDFTTNIVHYSNQGVCSWYDFAKTIFELANVQCRIHSTESKDYSTLAKRPHYSILNTAKIKQMYNVATPYWKDSLKQCMTELKGKL